MATEDDRQLARDLLEGKVSVGEVSKMRRAGVPPQVAPAVQGKEGPVEEAPKVEAGAVPEEKGVTVTQAPRVERKFPCAQCGARLDFDPAARALKCPYCGHTQEIQPDNTEVVERDLAKTLERLGATETAVIAGRSSEVRCPGCGANVLLEDNVQTDNCPFCMTHLANAARQAAHAQIAPESILPFAVSRRASVEGFNGWLKSRWFAPSDLKQLANLGQLSGVYVPYWTYDSMTYTHYTGQRGDDYWVTETYTTTENGKTVTRTRQVRRTRWTYVSGEVDHFFDDVLVCGSKSLPVKMVGELDPWDIGKLGSFKAEYLAGFKTERYVVTLPEGFGEARGIMDGAIRKLCCQDIGGDHQQLSTVATQHVGVTFKHILLPVWLAVYRYQNKTFRIAVNARTGEVVGDRPYSWVKIALFALMCAAVVAVVVGVIVATKGS